MYKVQIPKGCSNHILDQTYILNVLSVGKEGKLVPIYYFEKNLSRNQCEGECNGFWYSCLLWYQRGLEKYSKTGEDSGTGTSS